MTSIIPPIHSAIPLATILQIQDSLVINGATVQLLGANQINFGVTPNF